MSLDSVRAFLAAHAPDLHVIVSDKSSATVALAAEAFGVAPERIAKTLSLRIGDRVVLVVTKGTARLDNRKAKAAFGGKPRMLDADEVVALTGHPVGGVCPFGLATPLQVYCDVSLREFDEVVPAAGSIHSAVRITPIRMAELVDAEWVDVCQQPEAIQLPAAAPA
ncbi:MAG: YbaK/EbsC family protein [Tardiphaga sp.]